MEYRQVGKWGIKVSEISLGSWLTYGQSVSEEESEKQIEYAYNQGINLFDTANVYGLGNGEIAVGKALKKFKRDSFVLATKVFFQMGNGPNDKGLSRKHIFEQCQASLKRLQIDYIDIYQCHRFDPSVQLFELVRAMDDLTRQGKILYWGVSEWSAEQIEAAVKLAHDIGAMPPISNQPRYNLFHREIEEHVLPASKRHGLGQIVFSPLAQGLLTGKYKFGEALPKDSRASDENVAGFISKSLTKENLLAVKELENLAKSLNITLVQLALSWCLRLPEISSTIIGATSISHIESNVKASGFKLPAEALVKIEEICRSLLSSRV